MAVHPPTGASQADVTLRADGGVHRLHLTGADLRTGSARLTGSSIHDVLIVFRNASGVTIDAVGSEF